MDHDNRPDDLDGLAALLASVERDLALARAHGDNPDLIAQLELALTEIRAILRPN